MGVLHRVVKQSSRNQACGMGHIDHENSADAVCDLAHTLIVPFTAVCARAADDELGLLLVGKRLHLVIIDTSGFLIDIVTDGIENQS